MDPLASALALLALLAFAASAWGWGRLALSVCGLGAQTGIAYATALGLGALVGAGGWLNLFGGAYPPLLWAFLAAGWAGAALRLRATAAQHHAIPMALALQGAAVAAFAAFLAFAVLPSAAFNPYEDLQLYFPRVVRMLQTGSLAGNPFDPIGFDSLGAQAFLQSFTLLAFPLQYLNAFDAVLAAALALALVAAIGDSARPGAWAAFAAMAAFALLPARQHDISAAYAIAALVLALVPATARHLAQASWSSAMPPGLLIAALLGLKIATAAFLVPAALAFVGATAASEGWRAARRSGAAIAGWAGIFLLPWLALHAGTYAGWLRRAAEGGLAGFAGASLRPDGPVLPAGLVAALALGAALAGALRVARQVEPAERRRLVPLIALCAGGGAAWLLDSLFYPAEDALAQSAPVLLAAAPGALLLVGTILPPARARFAALGAAAAIALLFGGAAAERARQTLGYRTALAQPGGELPQFALLTAWGLSVEVQQWVRKAQAFAEPQKTIFALVACPYDLLFARNRVLVASESALASRWADLPARAGAAEMRSFLRSRGVRYVMWQVGAGMQGDEQVVARLGETGPARRILALRRSLGELTRALGLVHINDGLMVLDLEEPAQDF